MKIIINTVIAFLVLQTICVGAEFSRPDSVYKKGVDKEYTENLKFDYFKIQVDNKFYYCTDYEETNDTIILKDIFVEGSNQKDIEFMIVPKDKIVSIQKLQGESRKKIAKDICCGCFINSLKGE